MLTCIHTLFTKLDKHVTNVLCKSIKQLTDSDTQAVVDKSISIVAVAVVSCINVSTQLITRVKTQSTLIDV